MSQSIRVAAMGAPESHSWRRNWPLTASVPPGPFLGKGQGRAKPAHFRNAGALRNRQKSMVGATAGAPAKRLAFDDALPLKLPPETRRAANRLSHDPRSGNAGARHDSAREYRRHRTDQARPHRRTAGVAGDD